MNPVASRSGCGDSMSALSASAITAASGRIFVLEIYPLDRGARALEGGGEHRAQHVVGDQALLARVGAMTHADDHDAVVADGLHVDVEAVGVEAGAELTEDGIQRVVHGDSPDGSRWLSIARLEPHRSTLRGEARRLPGDGRSESWPDGWRGRSR